MGHSGKAKLVPSVFALEQIPWVRGREEQIPWERCWGKASLIKNGVKGIYRKGRLENPGLTWVSVRTFN
jgi:hypothetical protein